MRKRNKVLPIIDNVAKNVAVAASLPLGYVWLPISCCFTMPTIKYGMELDDVQNSMDKFASNFAGIVLGVFSTISCCCCLGCCGTRSPKEIYD